MSLDLSSQVCNLELSRKLKYLGVKQDSYFCWYAFENPLSGILKEEDVNQDRWGIGTSRDCSKGGADWTYSAFTVGELGDMLPYNIDTRNTFFHLRIEKMPAYFRVTYFADEGGLLNTFIDSIESDARAKMLVFLLENKLMSLPE